MASSETLNYGSVFQNVVTLISVNSNLLFSSLIFSFGVFLVLVFFFYFYGRTRGIWRFPGKRPNWSYSCRPTPQPQQRSEQYLQPTPQLEATPDSFFFFDTYLADPKACGGSAGRGPIAAIAAGLCQSYSNMGSEPSLESTPQLTATLDS